MTEFVSRATSASPALYCNDEGRKGASHLI